MRRPLSAATLLLVLACNPVGAEPINITSGFVAFTDEPGDFLFVGRGFQLSGEMLPLTLRGTFWFSHCHPDLTGGCVPGAGIDFGSTTYGVGDLGERARATIGGVVHEEVFYSGEWTFHGPSVIAPTTFDEQPLVREGDFGFEGSVFAYANESRTGTPLFSANLRGGGTARVFFGVLTDSPDARLVLHDLDYVFETQRPIPEPSTLLLAAAGVGAALRRIRRRSVVSTGAPLETRPPTS